MPRSITKGPFVDDHLMKKVEQMNQTKDRLTPLARLQFNIVNRGTKRHAHEGKGIPVFVTENMVGHKLGEFAPTRFFKGHGQAKTEKAVALK